LTIFVLQLDAEVVDETAIGFYVSLTVHHDVNQFFVTNLMHLVFFRVELTFNWCVAWQPVGSDIPDGA
jgi:hypothetical protein